MTREASKTRRLLGEEAVRRLFAGSVLDIGCGDDPVVPHAVPFDRAQGDAQSMAGELPARSFDCVHSSHCLEHMADVPAALEQWWSLVRPGGHLVLSVPDEDLYEQGVWPPLFNTDHKATFRLSGPSAWSPVSHDLGRLLRALPEAEVIVLERQDHGYRHDLLRPIGAWGIALWRLGAWRSAVMRRLLGGGSAVVFLDRALTRIEELAGRPVDQTSGEAVAQLLAIVRRDSGHPAGTANHGDRAAREAGPQGGGKQ